MNKYIMIAGLLLGWWVLSPIIFHKSWGGDWMDILASLACAVGIWSVWHCYDKMGKVS